MMETADIGAERGKERDGDRHGRFIAEDDVSNFARAITSLSTWMFVSPSARSATKDMTDAGEQGEHAVAGYCSRLTGLLLPPFSPDSK